jgi:putative sterol carrier protein
MQLQLATAFASRALQAAPVPSALVVSLEGDGDGAPSEPLRLGAAEAEACTLTCSPQAFIALVSGTLQPAAAVVRKQLQTSTLPALLQLMESVDWDRERFCGFVAEQASAERRGAQRAALDADLAKSGGGDDDVQSFRSSPDVMRRSRSRASIDEEAVRLAKLEMRRMAEESGDASAGLAGGLWTALSSMGGEATKSSWLLSGARLLRSAARGTGGVPEKLVEPDFDEMEKQGLDDETLLSVLGGDGALTQGFLFLPMAFLGCDWSGMIHVSVQHDGGTHAMTLVVTPLGPTLLHGHTPRVPMLTVVARREVLLDILEGKLDATRAVVTRQVSVSDLSKLILFKSAFRFKRAVWEAFRNAQKAKLAANQSVPADWQARLKAHPPDAGLLAQLEVLADDAELRDAAKYAVYAFCGSDWTGDVQFLLADGGSTTGIVFSVMRTAVKLRCHRCGIDPGAAAATPTLACSVSCARQVLLDVLTGRLEVTAATMSGKMQSDNFSAVMNFKRAFRFEAAAFREFCALVREAPAAAGSTPPADDAEPVAEPTPEERAAAAAATASVDPSVLALLGDDVELIDTVAYVSVGFVGSEMTVGLLCRVSDGVGDTPLQVVIGASPEGAVVLAGERMSELTVTCTIDCQREPLVQILRGDLEPLMALTSGQVMVDDLGQLMAWKCAFRFERSEFNAFLGERRRLAAAAGAPAV